MSWEGTTSSYLMISVLFIMTQQSWSFPVSSPPPGNYNHVAPQAPTEQEQKVALILLPWPINSSTLEPLSLLRFCWVLTSREILGKKMTMVKIQEICSFNLVPFQNIYIAKIPSPMGLRHFPLRSELNLHLLFNFHSFQSSAGHRISQWMNRWLLINSLWGKSTTFFSFSPCRSIEQDHSKQQIPRGLDNINKNWDANIKEFLKIQWW